MFFTILVQWNDIRSLFFVLVAACRGNGEADIAIILDRSGSIRREWFDRVKEYLVSVVSQYEVYDDKVRIACVTFSNDAVVVFYLNTYSNIQDINEGIMRIQYSGQRTNIAAAFEIVRTQVFVSNRGDRADAQVRINFPDAPIENYSSQEV